jgi:hypothetical protein
MVEVAAATAAVVVAVLTVADLVAEGITAPLLPVDITAARPRAAMAQALLAVLALAAA